MIVSVRDSVGRPVVGLMALVRVDAKSQPAGSAIVNSMDDAGRLATKLPLGDYLVCGVSGVSFWASGELVLVSAGGGAQAPQELPIRLGAYAVRLTVRHQDGRPAAGCRTSIIADYAPHVAQWPAIETSVEGVAEFKFLWPGPVELRAEIGDVVCSQSTNMVGADLIESTILLPPMGGVRLSAGDPGWGGRAVQLSLKRFGGRIVLQSATDGASDPEIACSVGAWRASVRVLAADGEAKFFEGSIEVVQGQPHVLIPADLEPR